MCALSNGVCLYDASSERSVELPRVIHHEAVHPQSVRVGSDPSERRTMDLFGEIKEASQVPQSRCNPAKPRTDPL